MMESSSPIKRYCEISTCMGVTDCYLEKSMIGKSFWAVLIVVGLIVTIGQTYESVIQFISEDPYSTTTSQQKFTHGIPFPSVTVCNFNRAKQSLIDATKIDRRILIYLFQLVPMTYDLPLWIQDDGTGTYMSVYEEVWKNYTRNGGESDPVKILKMYRHTAKDTIVLISIDGRVLDYTYAVEILTVYGLCWNVKLNFNQTLPGPFEGMRLTLNPQLNEYMKDVVYNNFFRQGFAVALDYDNEPFMTDAIDLAPGISVNIGMKLMINKIKFANFPLRSPLCNQNPVLKILKGPYTPQNCIYDCYLESVYNKCGCSLLIETKNAKYRNYCNLTTALQCATLNMMARLKDNSSQWRTTHLAWDNTIYSGLVSCSHKCIQRCDETWSVETSVTSTKYRMKHHNEMTEVTYNLNRIGMGDIDIDHDALIVLKIYFNTADVTVMSTGESTEIMTFIGNIGGQLGLWMGISMFSVVQLMYYFFVSCCTKGVCFRRRGQTSLK